MNDYQKTSKNNLPTATVSAVENNNGVLIGVDLCNGCDYVGMPSTEYKRLRDTIEAQQQEIDRLTNLSELGAAIVEHQSQILEALTADKDEQAGQIMKLEKVAKDLYFAYINKDEDFSHSFETKAIEQYQALLGGAEDEGINS